MKRTESDLIAESYMTICNEQYRVGTDFTEFTGSYEDDLMYYKDFQPGKFDDWLENERYFTTKYIAMGQDLVEMGIHADENSVYMFDKPTDFTHTAIVAK